MKLLDLLVACALLLALAWLAGTWREEARLSEGLARVVDGDTLAFGTHRVRLLGIDAPELDQSCGEAGREVPCGRLAREALVGLTNGGAVTCRSAKRDRYGRDLGRCEATGQDLGRAMVERGYAVSTGDYAAEEAAARAARRGIWAGPFERPADWRRAHTRPLS